MIVLVSQQTFRAAISALVVSECLVLAACVNKKVIQEQPAVVETQTVGSLKKKAIDINNDKKPDVWNYYNIEGKTQLVRKEVDLNFDGRIDITSFHEAGKIVREEIDSDFDGRIDWVDFYDEKGHRTRQEWDTDFDGKVDVWKYFDQSVADAAGKDSGTAAPSKLLKKERDTDGDGRPDYFEHYEKNGELSRIGRDTNGDGKEDAWDPG